jgi:hypothetical protein
LVLPLRAGENIAIGGLVLKILKKLNGLRLGFPFLSIVLTNATGLGAMTLDKYPCKAGIESSFGLSVNMRCKDKNNRKNPKREMFIPQDIRRLCISQ